MNNTQPYILRMHLVFWNFKWWLICLMFKKLWYIKEKNIYNHFVFKQSTNGKGFNCLVTLIVSAFVTPYWGCSSMQFIAIWWYCTSGNQQKCLNFHQYLYIDKRFIEDGRVSSIVGVYPFVYMSNWPTIFVYVVHLPVTFIHKV